MAKPTGWNRFFAKVQGEVPAAELDAFRRASAPVFELLEQVERRRLECSIDGLDPWTIPPATRAAFLCAWNAFVLQTLGNDFLDADYRAEPRTPHFVPPVTAEQVLRFYEQVEAWVNRAWQAQANPDFRLDVAVPAPLPAWGQVEPFPLAHLDGLLHAMRAVRDHADAAMAFLPTAPPPDPEQQAQVNRIRQLFAAAQARARYAEELCGHEPAPEVRERAGQHARAAIEQFYLLGQLASDPELARDPAPPPTAARPARAAAPARREPARIEKAEPRPPAAAPTARAERSIPPPKNGVPAISAPAAPLATLGPAASAEPASHLAADAGEDAAEVSTRSSYGNATEAEHTQTFDFSGNLPHEVHFSLRLAYRWSAEAESVELRLNAWSFAAYPVLTTGTFSVRVGGAGVVLRQMPGARALISRARGAVSFEQYIAYRMPTDLFLTICAAPAVGLLFETTSQGALQVDDATAARFQAYCRGFLRAIPAAKAKPATEPSPPV
jgi:hypothetical protein